MALEKSARRAILAVDMPRRTKEENLSNFGRAVERWRREHGLSQAVVANLIGTHQRTLSSWLRADGMPGAVYQVARLALLMGETAEGLLEDDADLAPLRDPEYLQRVLARVAPPRVMNRYLKGRTTEGSSEGSPVRPEGHAQP